MPGKKDGYDSCERGDQQKFALLAHSLKIHSVYILVGERNCRSVVAGKQMKISGGDG